MQGVCESRNREKCNGRKDERERKENLEREKVKDLGRLKRQIWAEVAYSYLLCNLTTPLGHLSG